MTDQKIEAEAKKAGGRWDGSRWVFEDADLHPFARALLAAERERIRVLVEAVRDANAASQDAEDCLIYTPAVQRAWEALLRGLQGPNARGKPRRQASA